MSIQVEDIIPRDPTPKEEAMWREREKEHNARNARFYRSLSEILEPLPEPKEPTNLREFLVGYVCGLAGRVPHDASASTLDGYGQARSHALKILVENSMRRADQKDRNKITLL